MPSNNVRERKVMHVGALVETTDKIFTLPNHNSQQDNLHDVLDKGAVGIIVKGPNHGKPRQYLINFVGGREYWMFSNEIQPYMGEKNV
jgi:hypothetical protein